MTHLEFQEFMKYQVKVAEILLLDFTCLDVCKIITEEGESMRSEFFKGTPHYELALQLLHEKYQLLFV